MAGALQPGFDDPGPGAVPRPVGLVEVSPVDVAPGRGVVLELQRDVNREPDAERFEPRGPLDRLMGSGGDPGSGDPGRIEHDGTLDGPDLDGLSRVLAATKVDVVASGGVGSLEDLRALADLGDTGRALAGVVVGRAFYERVFDVAEATAVLGRP